MKRTVFILMINLLATINLLAQTDIGKGKTHLVAFGLNVPLGKFSETHIAGISVHYSWSDHRFGKLKALPKKTIGYTAYGGIDYYFGKNETIAGYDYRYGGYLYLHAFGGAIYNPCKKGNITLTTGPVMGIYKGNADIGLGITLNCSYHFSEKIAFTPGVIYMKHNKTDALWAASLKATYVF